MRDTSNDHPRRRRPSLDTTSDKQIDWTAVRMDTFYGCLIQPTT
ncbi:hypothetical protein [Streptomyces sp. NPDC057682]